MALRAVKTSGHFHTQIIDESGRPDLDLTLYACKASDRHSERTARAYLRELVAFANWVIADPVAKRQGWKLIAPPETVQILLIHFLKVELRCRVSLGRDKLGFDTQRISPTSSTNRNIEHLLAALKSFFSLLRENNRYAFHNPMEATGARELIDRENRLKLKSFRETHGRNPMPNSSGIDEFTYSKSVSAYFRINGNKWIPEIIDDPTLFEKVLLAGRKWGWRDRELLITRILFETGCRIHEVCSLTIGDWAASGYRSEITCRNKGSNGDASKTLYISETTIKILTRYIDSERIGLDSTKRDLTHFSNMSTSELRKIPLFLTTKEEMLKADHFRRNFWSPALEDAGLRLRPHQIRHWFVTTALNDFQARGESEEAIARMRIDFRSLMGWKSDMLPTYDQAINKHNIPDLARKIHEIIEQKHKTESINNQTTQLEIKPQKSPGQIMLDTMFNRG